MIDIVVRIERIPQSGSDVLASQHQIATGGGYNAMSAASRQGVSTVYAGRLGEGPFSTIARRAFDHDEVAEPIEAEPDQDAGFCVAMIDDGGERTFITSAGAESSLRAVDLESLDVADGDYVLVSGYNVMYADSAPMVLEWIEQLSTRVVIAFDPAIRVADIPPEYLACVLRRADWLLCNEAEAATLSAETLLEDSVREVAKSTGRLGVVVRHGASGCTVLVRGGSPVHVAGFSVTVIDTNGAGDTHSGVFLAELARGTGVIEAAQRGNAAAAIAISMLGPASCPSREVVTSMISRSV